MDTEVLIYIGGVYHLAWATFDSLWPIAFNWKKTLKPLDYVQRTLPYIVSRLLVVLYLGIAYLSLFRTSELLHTDLGRDILIFISAYWIIRAVMQVQFFGLFGKANTVSMDRDAYKMPLSSISNQTAMNLFLLVFLFGIACYAIPLVML